MKRIESYIKSHRLDEVIGRLQAIDGLSGLSIYEIQGFGRGRGHDDLSRIAAGEVDLVPHTKIEVFCNDELLDEVMHTILEGAHTGLRGDGKIYVSPIEQAVRISTGERGEKAV
jgi:nitrogen regulatory protein PII